MNGTNVDYPATGFCCRNMNDATPEARNVPLPQGGGDLNGSQNTAHMIGQAGTAAQRVALPRRIMNFTPNWCGIV